MPSHCPALVVCSFIQLAGMNTVNRNRLKNVLYVISSIKPKKNKLTIHSVLYVVVDVFVHNFYFSSYKMNSACPCSICKESTHSSRKCPELVKDLETGFYKPAGGYQQGGDDDDEHLNCDRSSPLPAVFIENNTSRNGYIQRTHNTILANRQDGGLKRL
jgi:hypothetical protein